MSSLAAVDVKSKEIKMHPTNIFIVKHNELKGTEVQSEPIIHKYQQKSHEPVRTID